jgi:ribosomal protein L23
MSWRRFPTFLPNFSLKLLPLTTEQQSLYEKTGFLRDLCFRTTPNVNKIELKRFLEQVHGLQVETVQTLNYEGKKKRSKTGFFRRPDFKKVYVTLKDPTNLSASK